MSGGKKSGGAAVSDPAADDQPVSALPANGLEGADFKDPMLRLVQAVLGPFVAHEEGCAGQPCACKLGVAIAEIQRREILVKRYGVIDG